MDTLRPYDLHRMALDRPDLLPLWRCVELSRALDLHRTTENNCGRTPRSRSDQTAIAARSSRDRGFCIVESPLLDRTTINGDPGPRSTPDCGPIVARSWLNRGSLEEKLRLIHHQIEAEFSRN